MPWTLRIFATVVSEIRCPRFAIAPWIRPYPHVGLSFASRRTSSTISAVTAGRPPRFTPVAVVPVPGDEFAMPAEDGLGSHDPGQLVEQLSSEDLAFDGQPPPLVVVEQNAFLPELLPEYPVFGAKVCDSILLPTVYPAGKDQKQQLPGSKRGFHNSLRICGESPQHPGLLTSRQASRASFGR